MQPAPRCSAGSMSATLKASSTVATSNFAETGTAQT